MQWFTKLERLTKALQGHNEKIPETKNLPPTGFDPKQPPVADQGFPQGGGANPPSGAPTYEFAKFSRKLHEIERIWTPKGYTSLARLRSANDPLVFSLTLHETGKYETSNTLTSSYLLGYHVDTLSLAKSDAS